MENKRRYTEERDQERERDRKKREDMNINRKTKQTFEFISLFVNILFWISKFIPSVNFTLLLCYMMTVWFCPTISF